MSKKNNHYKEYCFKLLRDHCSKVLTVVKENIDEEYVFKVLKFQARNTEYNRNNVVMELEDLVGELYSCYYDYESSDEYLMQDMFEYGPNSIFGHKEDRHKMLLFLYHKLSCELEDYNDPYVYVAKEARNILSHTEIFSIENYKDKLTIMLILIWVRANFDLDKLSHGDTDFFCKEIELLEDMYSKKGNAKSEKILKKETLGYQKTLEIKRSILCEAGGDKKKEKKPIFHVYSLLKRSKKEIKPELFLGLFPCYIYDNSVYKETNIDRLYAAVFLRLRKAYIKTYIKVSIK